jgi:hypothetical protein
MTYANCLNLYDEYELSKVVFPFFLAVCYILIRPWVCERKRRRCNNKKESGEKKRLYVTLFCLKVHERD